MTFSPELISEILITSAYDSDDQASVKYGVSKRSIQRWRIRLDTDPKLAALVARKVRLHEASWADDAPAAIRSCISFIQKASATANPTDPDVIYSVAGALKILVECSTMNTILNSRMRHLVEQKPVVSALPQAIFESNAEQGDQKPWMMKLETLSK
jgi:hypothetical protein